MKKPAAKPVKKSAVKVPAKKTNYVLVRTYSAGVHFGELVSRKGGEVKLKNARRIWRWKGANTLSEVANNGISKDYSRVSEAVSSIELLEAIEIIPLTKQIHGSIAATGWNL